MHIKIKEEVLSGLFGVINGLLDKNLVVYFLPQVIYVENRKRGVLKDNWRI